MDNVWTNLGNRLETAWKRPTRPNSKRPKDGEIIDEEKSVRWNREEVVRRQKAWDAECSRLKKAQNAEIEHISEAIELPVIGAARCLLPAPFQETKYPVF